STLPTSCSLSRMSVPPGVVPIERKYPSTITEAGLQFMLEATSTLVAPFTGEVNSELQLGTAVKSIQDTSKSIGVFPVESQLTEPSLSITIYMLSPVVFTDKPARFPPLFPP